MAKPPPIGPMSEKQRRLEFIRRRIVDIESPLAQYFSALLKIPPRQITPELFADVQADADTLAEHFRRCAQELYDLLEYLRREPSADELLDLERERIERIGRKIAFADIKWEFLKNMRGITEPPPRRDAEPHSS